MSRDHGAESQPRANPKPKERHDAIHGYWSRPTRTPRRACFPSEKLLTEMGKYNEELVKAGVMLAGEGLQPSSKGARVRFSGAKRTVIDGPFAETKELIAGFWMWQVKSKEEAIEWVKRCPNPFDGRGRDRDSPGVRGGGLRRRVHARAAGAGRAPARADRRQEIVAAAAGSQFRVSGRLRRAPCHGGASPHRLPTMRGRRATPRRPPDSSMLCIPPPRIRSSPGSPVEGGR